MIEQVEYYTAQRLRLKVDRLIKQADAEGDYELADYLYFLHHGSPRCFCERKVIQ